MPLKINTTHDSVLAQRRQQSCTFRASSLSLRMRQHKYNPFKIECVWKFQCWACMIPNLRQCTRSSKITWSTGGAIFAPQPVLNRCEECLAHSKHPTQNSICSSDTPWHVRFLKRMLLLRHIYCVQVRQMFACRHVKLYALPLRYKHGFILFCC